MGKAGRWLPSGSLCLAECCWPQAQALSGLTVRAGQSQIWPWMDQLQPLKLTQTNINYKDEHGDLISEVYFKFNVCTTSTGGPPDGNVRFRGFPCLCVFRESQNHWGCTREQHKTDGEDTGPRELSVLDHKQLSLPSGLLIPQPRLHSHTEMDAYQHMHTTAHTEKDHVDRTKSTNTC